MSNINSVQYYHRNYNHDYNWKEYPQLAERITKVSLPFFALYEPITQPLSIGLGLLRSTQHLHGLIHQDSNKLYHLAHTAFAMITVAGTVFSHPATMALSTLHDLILETENFINLINQIHNPSNSDDALYQKTIESGTRLVNSLCYLALVIHGGTFLTIASLSIQILAGLYHSKNEYSKGNILEATAGLLMCAIRANQLKNHLEFQTQEDTLEDLPIEEIELTGNITRDASEHLRDVLTEQELLYVFDKLDNGQKIEPECLLAFARVRSNNRSFSSEKIRQIVQVFNYYNKNWGNVYRTNSFWNRLHLATFESYQQHFANENEHINYEMRRFNWFLSTKKQNNQLASPSFIEDFMQEALLLHERNFNALVDSIWMHAASTMHGAEKFFATLEWKENYDIMFQTEIFSREYQNCRSALSVRNLSKKYPKNSKLILGAAGRLFVNDLCEIIKTHKKYLTHYHVHNAGHSYYDGDHDYEFATPEILNHLSECAHLREIRADLPVWRNDFQTLLNRIITNCLELQTIKTLEGLFKYEVILFQKSPLSEKSESHDHSKMRSAHS